MSDEYQFPLMRYLGDPPAPKPALLPMVVQPKEVNVIANRGQHQSKPVISVTAGTKEEPATTEAEPGNTYASCLLISMLTEVGGEEAYNLELFYDIFSAKQAALDQGITLHKTVEEFFLDSEGLHESHDFDKIPGVLIVIGSVAT